MDYCLTPSVSLFLPNQANSCSHSLELFFKPVFHKKFWVSFTQLESFKSSGIFLRPWFVYKRPSRHLRIIGWLSPPSFSFFLRAKSGQLLFKLDWAFLWTHFSQNIVLLLHPDIGFLPSTRELQVFIFLANSSFNILEIASLRLGRSWRKFPTNYIH